MNFKYNSIIIMVILLVVVLVSIKSLGKDSVTLSGVQDGQAYTSVVTATSLTANKDLLKLGNGVLGSVVITGAATGTFELYDATTTNATLRTITATTSLVKLASFPASTAAGTYVFDAAFSQGLIVAFTGTQGTTTITYR